MAADGGAGVEVVLVDAAVVEQRLAVAAAGRAAAATPLGQEGRHQAQAQPDVQLHRCDSFASGGRDEERMHQGRGEARVEWKKARAGRMLARALAGYRL
jgi:hypothetical protein